MAFPMSAVSTSTTTETMRMQLRCYLGACLYDPEKVVIIPDVQFECVVSDEQIGWDEVWKDLRLNSSKEDEFKKTIGTSTYRDSEGRYHPNTGELGWLDFADCQRVHGAYTYDDDIKRDAILKEMLGLSRQALLKGQQQRMKS